MKSRLLGNAAYREGIFSMLALYHQPKSFLGSFASMFSSSVVRCSLLGLSARGRVLWQELGAMFEALRTVAVFYFRADKGGICDTLQVPSTSLLTVNTLNDGLRVIHQIWTVGRLPPSAIRLC